MNAIFKSVNHIRYALDNHNGTPMISVGREDLETILYDWDRMNANYDLVIAANAERLKLNNG